MHGQDKGLVMAQGRKLIEYAIDAASAKAKDIFISANRNIAEYEHYGYLVVKDSFGDYAGPLAGILTALDMIEEPALLLVLPCDMPLLSNDIIDQLLAGLQTNDADICCIRSQGRMQPLISIMHTRVKQNLNNFLHDGRHKVQDWIEQLQWVAVDISDTEYSLVNINTAENLSAFEQQADK